MDKIKAFICKLMYRFVPKRLLEDKDGYPTDLSWFIYRVQVKLRLRSKISICKGPFRIMWGDKEITNIQNVDIK